MTTIDYANEIRRWAETSLGAYAPTLTAHDRKNFLMSLTAQSRWGIAEAIKDASPRGTEEIVERYSRQPWPVPPFNWHEAIIGALGEGVDDEDAPNDLYRAQLIEAGALILGAISAYDRHFTSGGQQSPECDVCGTRHGVKGYATGDGWKTLRCDAHKI